MSDLSNLLVLLALGAIVGAVAEAQRRARTRGARSARAMPAARPAIAGRNRRLAAHAPAPGQWLARLERCYGFEVSIDGHDREPGRLWMIGNALTSLSLPQIERLPPEAVHRRSGHRSTPAAMSCRCVHAADDSPALSTVACVTQACCAIRLLDHPQMRRTALGLVAAVVGARCR